MLFKLYFGFNFNISSVLNVQLGERMVYLKLRHVEIVLLINA